MTLKSSSRSKKNFLQIIFLLGFGSFLALLILELFLRLAGAAYLYFQEFRNDESIRQKSSYRILCLGESTTASQYPWYLQEALDQAKTSVHFSVIDKGVPGTSTTEIVNSLEGYLDKYRPDAVVVMMGANDAGIKVARRDTFESILERFAGSWRVYKLWKLLRSSMWVRWRQTFGALVDRFLLWRSTWRGMRERNTNGLEPGSESLRRKESLVAQANQLLRREDFSGAYLLFEEAAVLDPEDEKILVGLGNAKKGLKETEEAFQYYKRALELNPLSPAALMGMGWVARNKNNLPESRDFLEKAYELDPQNANILVELGWLYLVEGRKIKAQKAFSNAGGIDPSNDDAYIGLGRVFLSQGDLDQAAGAFDKALELNLIRNSSLLTDLGRAYQLKGEWQRAQSYYEKAIHIDPFDADALAGLGWVFREMQEFSQAENYFKQAIAVSPEKELAYLGLGQVYEQHGSFSRESSRPLAQEAKSLKEEAESIRGAGRSDSFDEARRLRQQGRFSEANAIFEELRRARPEDPVLFVELAWTAVEGGQFSEAEKFFDKALSLNLRNDVIYVGMAWMRRKQKRFSEAMELLKKALEINSTNQLVYREMGWWNLDQGLYDAAQSAFKKACELDPEDTVSLTEIEKLKMKRFRQEEAQALFHRTVQIDPENELAYIELAWIDFQKGRFKEAEVFLKELLSRHPGFSRVRGFLSVLYLVQGREQEALSEFKEATRLRLANQLLVTRSNYLRLLKILRQKRVKFFCVQYPMRSLDPLRKVFGGDTAGIVFVDNETAFKKGVRDFGVREYFTDMFGGDFGHCTQKGNRLLAQNIAEEILADFKR